MSLSFVKSAVLSSTDGVSHNEETTIDNQETKSIRSAASSGTNKPLFEQLRANKEAQDAKDDEFQRSIRGMATLNDEDCAHLNAIEEQKLEAEQQKLSGIEREVALFHAAREDRGLVQTVLEEPEQYERGNESHNNVNDGAEDNNDYGLSKHAVTIPKVQTAAKTIVPKFTIKKKRKRDNDEESKSAQKKSTISETSNEDLKQTNSGDVDDGVDGEKSEEGLPNVDNKESNVADLLGLGCYGSDSD
jgi:hypothetical protein